MFPQGLPKLPFPPLVKVSAGEPLTTTEVESLLMRRPKGISMCVRSATGHADRGGYFFHIRPYEQNGPVEYEIFDFHGKSVLKLGLEHLTQFINHCTGLAFDPKMLMLCQTVVNLRLDPEPS